MKANLYSHTGAEQGAVDLNAAVFGIEPNQHVIWLDVRSIQANGRQGTHKSKERADVAYSTRKLYRQKGTGNARAGSAKSPVRVGGGTIFGPRPHKYSVGVNKKVKDLARRSALSHKAAESSVVVVEDFAMDAPSTKFVVGLLAGLGLADKKVLILTGEGDATNIYKSARNIRKVNIRSAVHASTFDILNCHTIVVMKSGLEALTKQLGGA
jgi:large subunit ribosomal protein L4